MPCLSVWLISALDKIQLLVLGDFTASTGTDGDSYETCVGPHGSGTVTQNSTKFLDFQEVMDLGWLVHGFRTHRLLAGLAIPTLGVWQRILTMCSLMIARGWFRTARSPGELSFSMLTTGLW